MIPTKIPLAPTHPNGIPERVASIVLDPTATLPVLEYGMIKNHDISAQAAPKILFVFI